MKRMLLLLTLALSLALCGCGGVRAGGEAAAETEYTAEVQIGEEAEAPGRQDGERFETVIVMEGMEETVRYEHIRSAALGFALDYDYERFTRRSEAGRECFVSIYDNSQSPENYLELTSSAESAETAAATVRASLSRDYELLEGTRTLENAGDCLRIEASVIKGTNNMADQIQVVYLIPAPDGCRIATAHYAVEAAEGFGRRFNYLLNTLTVLPREGAAALSDEQVLAAVKAYCLRSNPGLAGDAGELAYWDIVSSSETEIVVVFRSYTGALNRYYIDRASGEAYVTEQVPGILDEEQRTGESFNVGDTLAGQTGYSLSGIWQTASIVYAADGGMVPEAYVQFSGSEILYGRLSGGVFVTDRSDAITGLELTAFGGFRVQAQSASGVRYSYQSCESDASILEYYETWNESEFPTMYRGGASLSRVN